MKNTTVTTFRTTKRKLQYLRAISKRMGCKFKEKGSASYVLNYWTEEHARRNGVSLD